jgi:hypothetical protein
MPDEDGALRFKRGMASIIDEMTALYARDEIGAVSISIVLRTGDVRHLTAYDNGFKINLIGAAAIAQREVLDNAVRDPDPGNWHMPGPSTPPSPPDRDPFRTRGGLLSSKDGFDWTALAELRKPKDS